MMNENLGKNAAESVATFFFPFPFYSSILLILFILLNSYTYKNK